MSGHPGPVRLSSDRLTLRELATTDEAAVHAYASDPVVTRYLTWGPNTAEDTREFLAQAIAGAAAPQRTSFDLAVVHTDTGKLIGGAALRVTGTAGDIGYVFRRDVWSRGYGTETARVLLRFGFVNLGLECITATCDPDNTASATVLRKAGLKFEERIPRHLLVDGTWRDSLLFTRAKGVFSPEF